MTTKSNSATTWRNWITESQAKRAELAKAESELDDLAQAVDRATLGACSVAKEANHHVGVDINMQVPSREERDQVRAALSLRLSPAGRKRMLIDSGQALALSSHLQAMEEAERALDECQANHDRLTETIHSLAEPLATLEGERPEANAVALMAFNDQLESMDQDAEKIADLIASYSEGTSEEESQDDIAIAQAKLDELAALDALGMSSAEDKKAAQAALTKAKAAAQKSLEEANQRAAALRGLERKALEVSEQIAALTDTRDHVARIVHSDELAEYERQLIEYIQDDKVGEIMAGIRKAASALESVTEGSRYDVGRLVIQMPHLYTPPNRGEISGTKITI
ncbi:hypothetical protein [Oceanisphaera pacifica]|uniref:Uncharacterized protein n=1 Tax=Oceanisphaera pacifica TaxID=2818389 RepID=A0ABS3NCY7_9GAMM|nr:hypothetical protein [Oceanisphaera pacifica]MBO1518238.1 hypothetical protein [Oceanisphaera pacifica]